VKYSIDPNTNRLRIHRRDRLISPEGSFRINSENQLEYWLNAPSSWLIQNNLPGKITFIGTWKLTAQDDLQLSVDKASYLPESLSGASRITINGKIIAAEANKLVFEVHSRNDHGLGNIRLLKLSGSWGSDSANRISFAVTKRTAPDILTLSGNWSVNDNQQITYTLKKFDLVTKEKIRSTCEFSGYWQLSDKNRLAYIFSKGSLSRFNFKAQIETPNIYPKAGVIKYRLGTGVRQSKRGRPVIVCLYGEWRFSRNLRLSFNMEYEKGIYRSLDFGALVNVTRRDSLELQLLNESGIDTGIALTCTHRFLKELDAEVYLRMQRLMNDSRVEAGVRIPF
jgi:hypothetical protein